MVVNDPVADMLTRIRNANLAHHSTVDIPASKLKKQVARILKEEGYVEDVADATVPFQEGGGEKPTIRITLKYGPQKRRMLTGLKRISKPGLRIYVGKRDIPRVLGGFGVAILSTPKGVMSDRSARMQGIGGEVLAYVW